LTTLCRTFFLWVHNLFNPKLSYIPLISRTLFALNSDDWSYIPPVDHVSCYLTPNCPIYPLFFVPLLLSILMFGPIYPQLTTCFAELFLSYNLSNPKLSYIPPIFHTCLFSILMIGPIYPQFTTCFAELFLVHNLSNPKLSYIPPILHILFVSPQNCSLYGGFCPPSAILHLCHS